MEEVFWSLEEENNTGPGATSASSPASSQRGEHVIHGSPLWLIAGIAVVVVMVVARVWMKDDSPDLAPTMKELDRRLQQAEEWAVSLRLFQQSRRRDQTAADEDGKAGRYSVDND